MLLTALTEHRLKHEAASNSRVGERYEKRLFLSDPVLISRLKIKLHSLLVFIENH